MKKFTLLLMSLLMVTSLAFAQKKLCVHKLDGTKLEVLASEVSYIDFEDVTTDPDDDPVAPETGTSDAKPFSVSATKTVAFSPGNLQYHPVNDEWRFAPNQTDYIGDANANISSSYNGWIDLFGWGTGNNPTNNSTDYEDYPTFVDWGSNQIGSYAPNTWRTLTYYEWKYIIEGRDNAEELKGIAQVKGVNGLILLPDSWICPSGVTFKPGFNDENYYSPYAIEEYQTFNASDWAKLEASGAVFLPAAGGRFDDNINELKEAGGYWSIGESIAIGTFPGFAFSSRRADMYRWSCENGHSVRLVLPYSAPNVRPSVPSYTKGDSNGHAYVDLGLSVKWATCNVGANAPEAYGDYFAWGETSPKSSYSSSNYSYSHNPSTLPMSADAANANWGGTWRMPTWVEYDELRTQCTWTWTTQNGVKGYRVTSRTNGNSIFLPAAGYRDDSELNNSGSRGYYWSSSFYFNSYDYLYLSVSTVDWDRNECIYGQTVRPVLP